MFYALLALGLAYEFETSKHQQLLGWFNRNFIHKGLIKPQFGKMVNKASNRRTKGDYDSYVEFEKEIVEEMFEDMRNFINEIKHFIDSQSDFVIKE